MIDKMWRWNNFLFCAASDNSYFYPAVVFFIFIPRPFIDQD
ncbi:hypothetical protein DDI_3564 [Dickeya dianthicola RNS04.9]|nr:hypothetical protein DDI_3564 [Dickeya dianthicola RNS04.9]